MERGISQMRRMSLVLAVVAVCVVIYFVCAWPALLVGHKGPLRGPNFEYILGGQARVRQEQKRHESEPGDLDAGFAECRPRFHHLRTDDQHKGRLRREGSCYQGRVDGDDVVDAAPGGEIGGADSGERGGLREAKGGRWRTSAAD